VVGGASTFRQCLTAGLVDELHIYIMPVLLGEGLRLFEHLSLGPIELELTRVAESLGAIELRFRVAR
jgi:dihydrofolate reductase